MKKKFTKRLEYAQHKIFCIFIDVYKIHEGDVIEKLTVCLTRL